TFGNAVATSFVEPELSQSQGQSMPKSILRKNNHLGGIPKSICSKSVTFADSAAKPLFPKPTMKPLMETNPTTTKTVDLESLSPLHSIDLMERSQHGVGEIPEEELEVAHGVAASNENHLHPVWRKIEGINTEELEKMNIPQQ